MFRYETHLHTSPVSKCAKRTVRENLEMYSRLGYTGVFITNHFTALDGGKIGTEVTYEEFLDFYFSGYEEGLSLADEFGLKVFSGFETTTGGTDFLVYGLDKEWFLAHPEIVGMKKKEQLDLYRENGALVVHAHPFREAKYIDHIRLFPRSVHGAEVYNACRTDFENEMAEIYAEKYELIRFAGSDNHRAYDRPRLAGLDFDTPITDEQDFVRRIFAGEHKLFLEPNPLYTPPEEL